MRILTVVGNLERRGTQRVAQNFSLAYQQLGHTVGVLAYESGGSREQPLADAGIPVWIGGQRLIQAIDGARAFQPDIIHIHRPGMPNRRERWLLEQLKTPENRVLETNVFGRFDRTRAGELIDVHMLLSRWCLYQWTCWAGRSAQRQAAVIVPNPVDVQRFTRSSSEDARQFRHRLGLPDGAFLCGRIGNSDQTTFRAFQHLAEKDPLSYMLSVDDDPRIAATIAQLPTDVSGRVRVIPAMSDDAQLSLFYSSLDCLIHAVRIGESFGMVLAEAMACGCPVVTVARPHKGNSQVEVVGHRKGGLVAGSMRQLPKALREMRYDQDFRSKAACTAREQICDHYAVPNVAKMALKVAEIALNSSDRSELLRHLAADSTLITHVSRQDTQGLLHDTLGGPCTRDVMMMRLVHQPLIYAAYRRLLELRHPDTWRPPNRGP